MNKAIRQIVIDQEIQPDENSLAVLQGVGKVYTRGEIDVIALNNIDLSIQKKKFTFIVGPSGSGKTTLLNLLGCIDSPSSGKLTILDHNIDVLSDNQLADFFNCHF